MMDPDLYPQMYGAPQSAEAGGLCVEVGPALGRSVQFTRGVERYVYSPVKPLFCEDPVVRSDGGAAYLKCMRITSSTRSGFGFDYDSVLQFRFGSFPLSESTPERIALTAELSTALGGKCVGVTELDRISSGGRHLLLRIGVHAVRRIRYRSYWYDLETKALSEPDR